MFLSYLAEKVNQKQFYMLEHLTIDELLNLLTLPAQKVRTFFSVISVEDPDVFLTVR